MATKKTASKRAPARAASGSAKKTMKQVAQQQSAQKVNGAAAAAAAVDTPTKARTVIQRISARYAALTPAEESAYLSLATAPQCATLGNRTRGEGVLSDGVRWAVAIDDALQTYPDALRAYAPRRFSFLLGRLAALADALDAHGARRDRKGGAAGDAVAARKEAMEHRDELVNKLRTFAGYREAERRELSDAIGTAETVDSLAKSLVSLAGVAERWLGRQDAASVILAEDAGLRAEDVAEARGRAEALTSAAADVTMQPGDRGLDPPAVNVAEGRVLLEMREARRIFAEANAKDRRVPKLSPGPATRHMLQPRPARQEEPEEATEEVGADAPA